MVGDILEVSGLVSMEVEETLVLQVVLGHKGQQVQVAVWVQQVLDIQEVLVQLPVMLVV